MIADIGCWGRMVFMAESGFEIGDWPHLEAWAARLKGMSGFTLLYDLIPSKGPRVLEITALFAEVAAPGYLAQ
jgi:glutathione S-transferase